MREIFYIKIMYKKFKVLSNALGITIVFSMFREAIKKLL
jgi:hypothetical protein